MNSRPIANCSAHSHKTMLPHCRQSLACHRGGFSLVEVTLALAIAAMGIITVMGLMPVGIKNVRDAGYSVTSSRIYQELAGELQSMDWGTYTNGYPGWSRLANLQSGQDGSRRYFDAEGTRLSKTDKDFELHLSYVAEFNFPAMSVQMTGVAAGGTTDLRRDMRRVVIRLAESLDKDYVFKTDGTGPHQERTITVTRPY